MRVSNRARVAVRFSAKTVAFWECAFQIRKTTITSSSIQTSIWLCRCLTYSQYCKNTVLPKVFCTMRSTTKKLIPCNFPDVRCLNSLVANKEIKSVWALDAPKLLSKLQKITYEYNTKAVSVIYYITQAVDRGAEQIMQIMTNSVITNYMEIFFYHLVSNKLLV